MHPEGYSEIEEQACARGMAPATLMNVWLLERLRETGRCGDGLARLKHTPVAPALNDQHGIDSTGVGATVPSFADGGCVPSPPAVWAVIGRDQAPFMAGFRVNGAGTEPEPAATEEDEEEQPSAQVPSEQVPAQVA